MTRSARVVGPDGMHHEDGDSLPKIREQDPESGKVVQPPGTLHLSPRGRLVGRRSVWMSTAVVAGFAVAAAATKKRLALLRVRLGLRRLEFVVPENEANHHGDQDDDPGSAQDVEDVKQVIGHAERVLLGGEDGGNEGFEEGADDPGIEVSRGRRPGALWVRQQAG